MLRLRRLLRQSLHQFVRGRLARSAWPFYGRKQAPDAGKFRREAQGEDKGIPAGTLRLVRLLRMRPIHLSTRPSPLKSVRERLTKFSSGTLRVNAELEALGVGCIDPG
jgi:hypothetical protein